MDSDDPTDGAAGPLGVRLAWLGRAVAGGLRRRLDRLDLDGRQYRVLAAVADLEGCPQRALTARLHIPASRLVGIIDALEERHLVERVPNPKDRRAHALRITPAGRRLLDRATPIAEAYDRELVTDLSAAERRTLDRLLERVSARADAASAPGTGRGPAAPVSSVGRRRAP